MNNIGFSSLINEGLSSNLILGSSLILGACIGGLAIARNRASLNGSNEFSKKIALFALLAFPIVQSIALSIQGKVLSPYKDISRDLGALSIVLTIAIPILLSKTLSGKINLRCSEFKRMQYSVDVYPKSFIKSFAPYLFGDLKMSDGSAIELQPKEYLVEMSFAGNQFPIGYLPEKLAHSLRSGEPLKLKYRDVPIEISYLDEKVKQIINNKLLSWEEREKQIAALFTVH